MPDDRFTSSIIGHRIVLWAQRNTKSDKKKENRPMSTIKINCETP